MRELIFLFLKKSCLKIEAENNISINDFEYEEKQVYPTNIRKKF